MDSDLRGSGFRGSRRFRVRRISAALWGF
uniref:Uncharacterized protein n=1 Tax=Arundo donax TaxID=35708 RepID=A0A0A9BVU2_ARUDO